MMTTERAIDKAEQMTDRAARVMDSKELTMWAFLLSVDEGLIIEFTERVNELEGGVQ